MLLGKEKKTVRLCFPLNLYPVLPLHFLEQSNDFGRIGKLFKHVFLSDKHHFFFFFFLQLGKQVLERSQGLGSDIRNLAASLSAV